MHLTPRERELTDLICLGKSNGQIAQTMHISYGTVKEYLNRIFTKLEIRNRTALAMWALFQSTPHIQGEPQEDRISQRKHGRIEDQHTK